MAVINTSWLNQNAIRKFPLSDTGSGLSTTLWKLPDDLLVDLSISIPQSMSPLDVFLSKIEVSGIIVTLTFSSKDASVDVEIGTSTFNFDTHVSNSSYKIVPTVDYPSVHGRAVVGPTSFIEKLIPGTQLFTVDEARVELVCVKPVASSVTSIIANGSSLSGDVTLVAGAGVSLSTNLATNEVTISVDADSIDLEDCGCTDGRAPLRSINGVTPDSLGNINLVGTACLTITTSPDTNTVLLNDTCSKPCCECEGLAAMTANLEELKTKTTNLEEFILDIRTRLTTVSNIISQQGGI